MTSVDLFLSTNELFKGIDDLRANRFHAAIDHFNNVLMLDPDDKYAHWNKAMALLSLGDYAEGFKEHEWGWRLFDWRGFGPVRDDIDRLRKLPMWEGESPCSLLVYHELGFGDAIQCMRYLDKLVSMANVTLVINQELVRLVRERWPSIDVVSSVPDDLNRFDYRLPFFGVMHALRQTIENIPGQAYIYPVAWDVRSKRIGVVWSGRTNSFKFQEFSKLLDWRGFYLYSLQPGPVDTAYVSPLTAEDFHDTVQIIATMRHVVTVDTGVAHLAGAMGHPSVHVLLPFQGDWRWWNAEVWYPTIKTYRQKQPGDWSEPFAQLNAELRTH